jgi:hypothetical protein
MRQKDAPRDAPQGEGQGARRQGPAGPAHPVGGGCGHPQHHPLPTPDPHGHFFGKLRYGADQYDVYGRLIEKMAGRKGKLKFGGDAAPKPTTSLPKR